MQTNSLNACTIDYFGEYVNDFLICELQDVVQRFPILKYAHKQDFYTLLLVHDAVGTILVDEFEMLLHSRKVIFITPGRVSKLKINNNASGKIICFTEEFFSLRYNNNVLNDFSFLNSEGEPFIQLTDIQFKNWASIVKLLCKEYVSYSKQTKIVLRSYMNILLFEFEREYTPINKGNRNKLGRNRILELRKLIEIHYKEKKSPSDYATLLHISTNHLNKICKQEVGKTAGAIIRHYISIEAQRLLHHTHLTVAEVAIELGFENNSYFTTFFKKQTGKTPEKFRSFTL